MKYNIQAENTIEEKHGANINRINICFKIMWLIIFVLFIAIPFKIERLQSICYLTTIFLIIVCFGTGVLEKSRKKTLTGEKDSSLLLLVLVVVSTIVSFRFVGTFRMNLDNFTGYLNFIGMLFVVYYAELVEVNDKNMKFIGVMNVIIAILFAVLSFTSFAHGNDGKWNDSLTLGFSNPNFTAMLIFLNTIFLAIAQQFFEKGFSRFFITVLIIYNIYMIYQTRARSSFAVVLIVLFIYLLKSKKFKKHPIVSLLCVVSPIIFVFGYTYLYENGYFLDFEIFGKTIYSGREEYYLKILDELRYYDLGLVLGHFTEFQNTHNSALSLMRFFGITGMIMYYIFILRSLLGITGKDFENKMSYIAYIAILAVYIQSCAESAIILGGGAWVVYTLSLFAIAGMNREEKVDANERNDIIAKKESK